MKKLKAFSDHKDSKAWTDNCNYIDFTNYGSKIKFYTEHPELAELENVECKCALVIEPRNFSWDKPLVDYVEHHCEVFDYVFTHDDELLSLPNARFFTYAGMWHECKNTNKTKNLSIISSDYSEAPLHRERLKLARYVRDTSIGDAYGTFDKGKRIDTATAHSEYRFAIAVENHIEDYWFTEKIINCFATNTVPIYIGARKIDTIFNGDGIIQCGCADDVIELLKDFDFVAEYDKRHSAIKQNHLLAQRYRNPFDMLYLDNIDIWRKYATDY